MILEQTPSESESLVDRWKNDIERASHPTEADKHFKDDANGITLWQDCKVDLVKLVPTRVRTVLENSVRIVLEKRRMEGLQTKLNGTTNNDRKLRQTTVAMVCGYHEVGRKDNYVENPLRHTTHQDQYLQGGIDAREKLCHRCRSSAETDLHVLSECHPTKDIRICRHNSVVRKLAKELKKRYPSNSVQMERTWAVGNRHWKPDITMVSEDGKATFVEVTIPYERDGDTLKRREQEKEEKYECLTPVNLRDDRITSSEVVGLAFGAAGTINKETGQKLKKWKLWRTAKDIQMICLSYPATIWQMHTDKRARHRTPTTVGI